MKHGIKLLYGILAVGILISIFHMFNDHGGSALGNVISTLTITSLILFIATIVFILISFKQNSREISVWILLLLSCPLALMSMTHLTEELYLKLIDTTTPHEFVYTQTVAPEKYYADKIHLQWLIDSLINVKTIERPSVLALRYFNGKTYKDSIERDWAIDLPHKIEYKESIIDTLFYSEKDQVIAGLLINKVFNNYSGKIEYFGKGFVFNETDWKPFVMLQYSVTGYDNYELCSKRLRYYYLKKIGTYDGHYNMNDIRFLKQIE